MSGFLEWFVYCEDVNRRVIEPYNIFNHVGFLKDCCKAAEMHSDNKDVFAAEVERWLKYYYWAKCEWEIILSSWPNDERTKKEKIDVYDQVMLNFDVFIDYLWNNKHLLKEALKAYDHKADH